jgi:hypothetical protein
MTDQQFSDTIDALIKHAEDYRDLLGSDGGPERTRISDLFRVKEAL